MPCRRSILALLGLLLGTSLAPAAADRCNPQAAARANALLEISVADAPADLVLQATTARPVLLGSVKPRMDGNTLAEDLAVAAPDLRFGDLMDNQASLQSAEPQAAIVATSNNRRYRLQLVNGKLGVSLRPMLEPAGPMVVKRGAVMEAKDGNWTLGANARLEWVATAAQPLRVVLNDSALLPQAAPDIPAASIELASARVSPGATVPLLVRGTGPALGNANFRLCLLNGSSVVDLPTKRAGEVNDGIPLSATLPGDLRKRLSDSPGWWQTVWGEPVRLKLMAWSDGQPVLELRQEVLMTQRWVGAVFGILVLGVIYLVAGWSRGTLRPLTLFDQLVKHGKTGRLSLTSFQTLCWTLVVVFALCFSWYCSGVMLELRPDVLQLLGIVGGSHVLTRAVEAAKPASADAAAAPKGKDLVTDAETGEFDILRFQMLAFTLFSLVYVLFNVWISHGLPELPQSLYWLMGLGNIVHVGAKLPEAMGSGTPAASATLNSLEAQLGAERIRAMQAALSTPQTGVLDAATREALVRHMSANGLYPVGQVSELLLKNLGV
ncbi:hypothetical protein ACG04Q_20365 [Roseateles sp. DXS20W]|uniref:Uncharacterized protein n=1 Tax=Pelomonas lactea TaxID=3299030 RepID=A0ABW7GPP1_9BURK